MTKYLFKIVSIGSGAVGKTSLIRRFASGKFQMSYLPTLGVDITSKQLEVDGEDIKLICADFAGQEHFGKIRGNYYQGANGGLLVFDLTRKESFSDCAGWLNEFRMNVPDHEKTPLILLGNKSDLIEEVGREVAEAEIGTLCESEGLSYYDTSAKTGLNVETAFQELASRILALRVKDE
ncbi:MAG: Rab family GTPase [Candidatus Heimdallarchaeota archaeon]